MDSAGAPGQAATTERGQGLAALEQLKSRRDRGETLASAETPLNLAGLRLSGSNLSGLDLSGVDLSGAELSNCNLSHSRLVGAKLTDATAQRANFTNAELLGADLTNADLSNATLDRAGLGRVVARGARFFGASCGHTTFSGSDLRDSDFRASQLHDSRMRDVQLQGADLEGADMAKIDLTGANVTHASLRNSMLQHAMLRDVTGYKSADWIGADVGEVNFTGAWLLRRHVQDTNFIAEFRRQSRLHEALYRLWWVTSDCGRSLMRWGIWTVLVALLYGWLYTLVDIEWGSSRTWLSPMYYSVVTFTTLGYGDILPGSVGAQAMAISQVILGYFSLGGMMSILSDKMARRAG